MVGEEAADHVVAGGVSVASPLLHLGHADPRRADEAQVARHAVEVGGVQQLHQPSGGGSGHAHTGRQARTIAVERWCSCVESSVSDSGEKSSAGAVFDRRVLVYPHLAI